MEEKRRQRTIEMWPTVEYLGLEINAKQPKSWRVYKYIWIKYTLLKAGLCVRRGLPLTGCLLFWGPISADPRGGCTPRENPSRSAVCFGPASLAPTTTFKVIHSVVFIPMATFNSSKSPLGHVYMPTCVRDMTDDCQEALQLMSSTVVAIFDSIFSALLFTLPVYVECSLTRFQSNSKISMT